MRYIGIGEQPDWDQYPDVDTVDHGIELVGDDGRVVWLSWGDSFHMFALEVEDGVHFTGDQGAWDVSSTSRWKALIGAQVRAVRVDWVDEKDESVALSPRLTQLVLFLLRGPLVAAAGLPARADVSQPPAEIPLRLRVQRWLALRLADALTRLVGLFDRSERARLLYPFSIELAFGARRVWIGVVQIMGVDRRGKYELFQGDTLSVAFDEVVAREFKLVPA